MKINKIIFLILLFPTIVLSQHTITVTFSPAKDFTWAVLYKNYPTKTKYIAQSRIVDGNLVFKLDENATKGIYKLVYAVPQNEYNFDIIYNGDEDIEITFNLNDGAVFQKSTENIMLNSYLTEMALFGGKIRTEYSKDNLDENAIATIFNDQEKVQKAYKNQSNGKLVNHFIKVNQPYIPQDFEAPSNYYKNQATNYFKNIDFNDEVLQSSNLLLEKSFAYITGMRNKGFSKQDNSNYNIDQVVVKTKITNPDFQKVFLDKMWEKLNTYKLIESANYLAEKHLIPLAKQQNDTVLELKLTQFKNLSIGNQAPDFVLDKSSGRKLSELDIAENYILVFWSSGCSHCLKEVPQLYQIIEGLNSTKYKVIAVGLEEDTEKWSNEIKKFPDFINVDKIKKWDNTIVNDYALTSTPTYFVLDKDKKFIEKPEDFEGLKTYLNK